MPVFVLKWCNVIASVGCNASGTYQQLLA